MSIQGARESIDEDLVRCYHENGFLVVRDLFTLEEKESIKMWVAEIQNWPETPHKWLHYFEPHRDSGSKLLCRTENFIPYHGGLRQLLHGERMLSVVGKLLGEPALLYKDKINFKLPGGTGFDPHQDAPAYIGQGQTYHVTALIAADPATIENGCLEFVIGGHKRGILPHTGKNGSIPELLVQSMEWTPLPLEAGDIAFFGSYIPHRSGRNNTNKPRRSFYITYNGVSGGDKHDAYYADKRRMFPPDSEKEPGKDYSEGAKIYNLANPIRHFD
jgi:2-aminoethylphosphonate dioxygenase